MQTAVPAPPPRDTRLDVMRGWLQLTIFFSHATGSFAGLFLVYGSWGLSDSSEQFIFLSGLVLGSVYARVAARDGVAAARRDMWRRTLRLYRTDLIVFALFALMMIAADLVLPHEAESLGWGFLLQHPLAAIPAALTLLYQPENMGILPIFIWCMLALPAFDALQRRVGDAALAVPAALYAVVRLTGLNAPALSPDTGIAFDPFAWQFVFMLGAWFGRRRLLRGPVLPRARGVRVLITLLALGMLALGLVVRLSWMGVFPFLHFNSTTWIGKEELAPTRLLHALSLTWLVVMLVPADARWMHTRPGRALAAIGRHSLQVFCVGLFLSWMAGAALRLWPPHLWPGHFWIDPFSIALGAVILGWVGWWCDRRLFARRRAPAMPDPTLRQCKGAMP